MLNSLSLSQVMVIDIETVPQYSSYSDLPNQHRLLWEHKTTYQRGDRTAEEFYEKAGIMAEFGKIICLSMGVYDTHAKTNSLRIRSISHTDEKLILQKFAALLAKQLPSLIFCAHNGKEFDYPYLCRRFLINGLKIPLQLQLAGKKPWDVKHLDTMELWKFGDHKHFTSLDLLASVLNIPSSKDDISGGDVKKVFYEDRDLEQIVTYCQKDVITTAQILLRYKGLPLIPPENITFV